MQQAAPESDAQSGAGEGWEAGEDLGLDLGCPDPLGVGPPGAATAVGGGGSVVVEGWEEGGGLGVIQDSEQPRQSVEEAGPAAVPRSGSGVGLREASGQLPHTTDVSDAEAGNSGGEATKEATEAHLGSEYVAAGGAEEVPATDGAEGGPEGSEGVSASSEGGRVGVPPLHACWAALLEKQLLGGEAEAVLRRLDLCEGGLVTAGEGRRLIAVARSSGRAVSILTPKVHSECGPGGILIAHTHVRNNYHILR